jgi:hypothetical protein
MKHDIEAFESTKEKEYEAELGLYRRLLDREYAKCRDSVRPSKSKVIQPSQDSDGDSESRRGTAKSEAGQRKAKGESDAASVASRSTAASAALMSPVSVLQARENSLKAAKLQERYEKFLKKSGLFKESSQTGRPPFDAISRSGASQTSTPSRLSTPRGPS